jgi:hypothetical protein
MKRNGLGPVSSKQTLASAKASGKYDEAVTDLARKFSSLNRHQVNALSDAEEDKRVKKQHVHIVLVSLSVLIIYFVVGVLSLRILDSESFTNSYDTLYFTVVTLTSVGKDEYFDISTCSYTIINLGYGDYFPRTPSGRLFVSCYAFLGLMILTASLVELVTYWLAVRKALKEEWNRIKAERGDDDEDEDDWETPPMFHSGASRNKDANGRRAGISVQSSLRELSLYRLYDINKTAKKFWIDTIGVPPFAIPILQDLSFSLFLIFSNVIVGAIFYAYIVDKHTIIDAIYLSACTVTTIGYGDVVPSNNWSKAFTMIYCIIGTLVTAQALNSFNNALSNYRKAFRNNIILTNQVNMLDLFMMDVDGDGTVTKAEYMIYKLIHMKMVDPEVIARVERQFHVMDVDGSGTLTIEDINKQFPNMLITHRDRRPTMNKTIRTDSGRIMRQRKSVISTSLSDIPDLDECTHGEMAAAAVSGNVKLSEQNPPKQGSQNYLLSSKVSSRDIDIVSAFDIEEGGFSAIQRHQTDVQSMSSVSSSLDSDDTPAVLSTPKVAMALSREFLSAGNEDGDDLNDGESKHFEVRVKPSAEKRAHGGGSGGSKSSRGRGKVVARNPSDDENTHILAGCMTTETETETERSISHEVMEISDFLPLEKDSKEIGEEHTPADRHKI